MKKYLLSTLTVAAAMAVPAWADVELIASWDFSATTAEDVGSFTGSVTSDTGYTLTTGSSLVAASDGKSGYLNITSKKDGDEAANTAHKTTIDISSEGITLEEGISVVLTITGWSSSSNCIFASIETDNTSDGVYAAAIGENGSSNSRDTWFAADGSTGHVDSTQYGQISVDWTTGITVAMTFIGDTLSLYQLQADGTYKLLGEATIKDEYYSSVYGNITEVALGSWDYISTDGEFSSLQVSSVEIWRGDIMAAPEPSMFGLMFGLGTIGLVATRRRKRA